MVVSDQKQWFVVEHAAQEGIVRPQQQETEHPSPIFGKQNKRE
jgi:hypothetical protein